MNAESIARALGGASKTGSGWSCKCPAHSDGTASLSLDEKDGRLLWHCHAGCSQAAVGDALKAKGMLPERTKRERKDKPKLGPIVATYDYADADGVLVLQVLRYNEPEKTFRQRRPDPSKPRKWIWSVAGISRPPYRLPELLAADPAADVFLVEGEKDADRLRSLGLTATTSSQGAGNWKHTDHSQLLGRHIVIVPDNDSKGRGYAAEAGRDLVGKAASLRLLELPELPEKGDVSDWVNAGGTADDLRRLAADAPHYDPQPAEEEPPRRSRPAEHLADAEDIDAGYECWNEELHRTDRGEARDIIHNVALILRIDNRFKGHLRWNEMLEAVEAQHLPWRKGGWAEWTDADDIFLAEWCQKRHAYLRPATCAAAVQVVARDLMHHPVRERLDALVWDGVPRLSTCLATYLGVTENTYTKAVGRAWMISAVARVSEPGCKADHCLILEGGQGVGKSTAAATIAMDDAWFADEIADLGTKDSAQGLRGKWIIEIGELSAMRRGEVERVKAFMSRRVDHYRPSYGRRSQDFARQCVFVGTMNAETYLADETGGRRFWPVRVGTIDLAALKRDREQLWAEAVAAYRAGAQWWLDKETEKAAAAEQDARRVPDAWKSPIMDWCAGRTDIDVPNILSNAIGMDIDRQDQTAMNRVARVLKANGWERRQRRVGAKRAWLYSPPGLSPVSPVWLAATGDTKSNDSKPVTSVTSNSLTHAPAHALARTRAQHFSKPVVTTGDTGNSTPAWGALAYWERRLSAAGDSREGRKAVASEWCAATGGQLTDDGVWHLPPDLPNGPALVALKQDAGELGLLPKAPVACIDVNDARSQRPSAA